MAADPDRTAAYSGVITADTRVGDLVSMLTDPEPAPTGGLVIETVDRDVAIPDPGAGLQTSDLEIAEAARARRAPVVATAGTLAAGYGAWGLTEAAAAWGPAGAAGSVVAATCAATAVALPVLRVKFRHAIPEAWRRRWWLSGVLGAAWVDLAALTSPATALMTGGLVVGSAALHARWAAAHEVPYPSQLAAPEPILELPPTPEPEPEPVLEITPSRAQQLEDSFYANVVGGQKIAAKARLTDRTALPNGTRWTIELDSVGNVSSSALQRRGEDVARALGVPERHVILEPGCTAAHATLTVVTHDLLAGGVDYHGPEYHDGRVPVGLYADGSGVAEWIAWQRGQGVRLGCASGEMGSGKTALLELVGLGLRSSGCWRVWWGDGDPEGSSSPLMMDGGAHWPESGAEGLLRQLEAFIALMNARAKIKHLLTEDPVTGLPVERTSQNQRGLREFVPCPQYPAYMWLLPEFFTICQDPVLTKHNFVPRFELALRRARKFGLGAAVDTQSALGGDFKGSTSLRGFLQSHNAFVMRTMNRTEQHVVNGLTVSPGTLPEGGGYGFVPGRGRAPMMRTSWQENLHDWLPALPACQDDPDALLAIQPFLPEVVHDGDAALGARRAEVEAWRAAARAGQVQAPSAANKPAARPTSVGGVAIPKAPGRATVTPLHPDVDPDLLAHAADLVVSSQFGSPSMLHRKLRIPYAEATQLMRQLQARGVVGPANDDGLRPVLVTPDRLDAVLAAIRGGHPVPAPALPIDPAELPAKAQQVLAVLSSGPGPWRTGVIAEKTGLSKPDVSKALGDHLVPRGLAHRPTGVQGIHAAGPAPAPRAGGDS